MADLHVMSARAFNSGSFDVLIHAHMKALDSECQTCAEPLLLCLPITLTISPVS